MTELRCPQMRVSAPATLRGVGDAMRASQLPRMAMR